MKYLMIMIVALALTACNEDGGGSTAAGTTPASQPADISSPSTSPSTSPSPVVSPSPTPSPVVTPVSSPTPSPTPSPSPVVTPSPSPSPSPAPAPSVPSNATKTSTYGQYTCALLATGTIWCSDGTTAVTTPMADFVDVVVGNGVVCGLQIQNPPYSLQLPSNCTALSSGSCVRPPTYYGTYCWDGNSQAPVAMQIQNEVAPQVSISTYVTGPASIGRDSQNRACINQDVYNLQSSPYGTRTQTIAVCGTAVTSGGYLQ